MRGDVGQGYRRSSSSSIVVGVVTVNLCPKEIQMEDRKFGKFQSTMHVTQSALSVL